MKCENCGKEKSITALEPVNTDWEIREMACVGECLRQLRMRNSIRILLADEEFWVGVRSELAEHYDDKKKPIEIVKEAFRSAAGIKEGKT